jgi:hypothetical protein
MKHKDILRIIDGLKEHDALLLVVWERDQQYPRVWLREWCGFPLSVSIATAECVLEDILSGRIKPRPVRPRRIQRRLPAQEVRECYIETVFV